MNTTRNKILMGIMLGMIVFTTVKAEEDEDEGGWGGGEGDDGEGRHLLGVQPTMFSKLLTAAGMGAFPTTPSVTASFLSFKNDNDLVAIVETPDVHKVYVKTPGFTSTDGLSAVFENANLVIRGQLERKATDCDIGRRFAQAEGCAPKMSSSFEHSVEWPSTIAAGLTLEIKSEILTVNVPKIDTSSTPK